MPKRTTQEVGPARQAIVVRADRFGPTLSTKGEIMGDEFKKPAAKPMTDRQFMCDNDILRLLADQQGRSLLGMAVHFQVTQTAIRDRLVRLTTLQSVTRKRDDERRRGRPRYLYYITSRGEEALAGVKEEENDNT